ncbi:hypothetical protein RD792_007797, partial [Penstemon davidsonii]
VEGKEDIEIEDIFKMSKKKKKIEKSSTETALLVGSVMAELDVVVKEDVELTRQGKPAINKLKKLSLFDDILSKKQLQPEFLDHGVLTLLKNWLEPLPDGSLPNRNIREAVLKILNDFPIDLEQQCQKEQLKKSGLGKSRALFDKSTRFEDLKNLEDERVSRPSVKCLSANIICRSAKSGQSSSSSSSSSRPEAMSMDFVVCPHSKVDPDEVVRARAKRVQRLAKRLVAPKRKQLQATKRSVDGRGMFCNVEILQGQLCTNFLGNWSADESAARCSGGRFRIIAKAVCSPRMIINALSLNHYGKTCPSVDDVVAKVVKDAISKDKTIPAAILRLHFHDCFIRGCDGSVLLESGGGNSAEKDAPPNASLHAFYVIEGAKKAVENVCPGVVSCADILALAARDAIMQSGGPYWNVPKGRKDGRTSKASETTQLPSPTFNISQLQKNFSQRGLSMDDLVALLGGHTLGFSHCSSFQNRIQNFNSTHEVDPSMRPSFAARLKSLCLSKNKAKNAGTSMDPFSSTTFDNTYYKLILQKKALFSSDQSLLTTPKTKKLVEKFASSKKAFHTAFANSMIKMSNINGGQEIRKDCRFIN